MNPLRLRIAGFLSYLEPAEINFSEFDIACISGANGAGKSSLLDAITWALFGQARRSDDALIHSHAALAQVTFDFEYEGNRYRIQRSKPRNKTSSLEFFVYNAQGQLKPLTEASIRKTEERIQSILRLDYDTFINSAFFLQGKADQFAQQRPSERKRILSSILGLDVWEQYRQTTAEHRKREEAELSRIDGQLAEIEIELSEEPQRKQNLQQAIRILEELSHQCQAQAQTVEWLRQQSNSLSEQRKMLKLQAEQLENERQQIAQLQHQLQERQAERQQLLATLSTADTIQAQYLAWQQTVIELQEWETLAEKFRALQSQRYVPQTEIETERARLQQEQKSLLEKQQQAKIQKAQIISLGEQIAKAEAESQDLREQLSQRSRFQQELEQLSAQAGELKSEQARLKQAMYELQQQIETLEGAQGCCPTCNRPLSPEDRQTLIQSLRAAGEQMGNQHRSNQATIAANTQRQEELRQQIKQIQNLEPLYQTVSQRWAGLLERQQTLQQSVQQFEQQFAPRLLEVSRQLAEEDFCKAARAELARIDAALHQLGYDPQAHQAARQAEQTGRASQQALQTLEKARAALTPLEGEITRVEQQLHTRLPKLEAQQQSYHQLEQSILAIQLPNLDDVEAEYYRLQEKEKQQHQVVGAAQQKYNVLTNLRLRQADLNRQRAECTAKISRLKTLEQAFGKDGVPALLIEQALPEIEEHANQLLDRLSDGNMSVRFVTQRDYKDKSRDDKRETLDILISDSAGSREYEMFSGGEAFRVNFAIRLALSRVLAQRAGARLQLLVIDEGFGSQDADGIQRLIEAIHLVRNDFARILVITHLEGMKDAFPTRIEVEKAPIGSQIKVISL